MFKKLLSNLPFNPSLIGQVAFYAKRMNKETSVRRMGLILVVLAFFVQFFAFISPPQPSLAASGNDIIPGGFAAQGDAVNWCNTNVDIRAIYAHFGVSCDAIARASVQIRNTRDYNSQLYSLGRYPYGKPGETPVQIGGTTFYMRFLWGWGDFNFRALVGTRDNGTPFMIMFDCGNIVIVGAPTPPPPAPPPPAPPPPTDVCPTNPGVQTSLSECDVCPNIPGNQTSTGQCDVCPNIPGTQNNISECDVCPNISGIQTSTSQCDVCPNIPGTQSSTAECKPCDKATTDQDTSACIILSKTASNTTSHQSDANGTTATAGDVIDYTLKAQNTGKVAVQNFSVEENIGDILEYADVIDFHGGKLNSQTQIVTWPGLTVGPGATIEQHLTVKIKNPIPQTPVSTSNPGTGDLTMTNVYGNTVNIKLPPTVIKTTEQLTTTLPNTGPGTSLIISFGLTTMVAYFFARTRLMAKELDIVRVDFTSTGGA